MRPKIFYQSRSFFDLRFARAPANRVQDFLFFALNADAQAVDSACVRGLQKFARDCSGIHLDRPLAIRDKRRGFVRCRGLYGLA
jgi:hypothetical protein